MVNNSRSDGSIEGIKADFTEAEITPNSATLGFAVANSIGAREAKGEYVAFPNNDTCIHSEWLVELPRSVSRKEGVACAGDRIRSRGGGKVDFASGVKNSDGIGFQKGPRRAGQKHMGVYEILERANSETPHH